jgi:hypothetical protein
MNIDEPMGITAILVSAIAALWKVLQMQYSKVETRLSTKLDKCEEKHEEVNTSLLTLHSQLGELRGRQQGVEDLASQVLRVVAESRVNTNELTTKTTTTTTTTEAAEAATHDD